MIVSIDNVLSRKNIIISQTQFIDQIADYRSALVCKDSMLFRQPENDVRGDNSISSSQLKRIPSEIEF